MFAKRAFIFQLLLSRQWSDLCGLHLCECVGNSLILKPRLGLEGSFCNKAKPETSGYNLRQAML